MSLFKVVGISGIIVLTLGQFLWCWQFPVKNLRITSLFGESRIDHFHNGIDFAGEQLVYPIEDGEIIFYREEDSLSGFISVGNYMVVEHRDEIRSFYYHLADNSIEKKLSKISKTDTLAYMGNTGKSFGSHLHLTVVDSQQRRVLNPQLILPILKDTTKPIISSLFFTIKNKPNIFKIRNRTIIKYNNNIKLYLIAGDIKHYYPLSRNLNLLNAWGLRRVTFRIDDQVYKNFEFNYFQQDGNRLVLQNGHDFSTTYGLAYNYLIGDFLPIQSVHRFNIEVEDWAGNTDVENYQVIFRL